MRMQNAINGLQVVYRARPLVDVTSLDIAGQMVDFRFEKDSIEEVKELRHLDLTSQIDLGCSRRKVESVLEQGN